MACVECLVARLVGVGLLLHRPLASREGATQVTTPPITSPAGITGFDPEEDFSFTIPFSFSLPVGDMRCPVCEQVPSGDRVIVLSAGAAFAKNPAIIEDGDELYVARSYCPEHAPEPPGADTESGAAGAVTPSDVDRNDAVAPRVTAPDPTAGGD